MTSQTCDIAVLGAGSWGTTLAVLLHENAHRVRLWARRPEHAAELSQSRRNARYLPDLSIPEGVTVTGDLVAATRAVQVVVLAVPSHGVRGVVETLTTPGEAIYVNTAKGLEEGTLERMSTVVSQASGVPESRIFTLVGPSHAEEVSRHIPTSIVVAGADAEGCRRVQALFARPYFRVYTNGDVLGVEIATALKNAIALAAGVIDGLGYGDNTKAALVTRGLAEITRLGGAMGARSETFSGLAGVGDLVVTCLSRHSRNRRLGEMIGAGKSLDEALSEMVMVAEGVRTARAAADLGRGLGVELPIIEMVNRVLFEGSDPGMAVGELMTRPLRDETNEPKRGV